MKISFNKELHKKKLNLDRGYNPIFDDIANKYEGVRFESSNGSKFVNDKEQELIINILNKFFPVHDKKRVLDVGAGNGRWSRLFLAFNWEVYSLDNSSEMIKILSKIDKLNVVKGDIQDVNISDKFDLVFSMRAVKYTDLGKVLVNIRESLNDNGLIILELPYRGNPFYFLLYCSSLILINFFKQNTYLKYFLMINLYSKSSIKKIISNCDCKIVGIKKLLFFPDFAYSRVHNRYLLKFVTRIDAFFSKIFPRSLIFIIEKNTH